MSSPLNKIHMFSLVAALLPVLTGCETDGRNASDNPSTAVQLVSNGGTSGGGVVTPLPEAGVPQLIDSEDLGDVTSAKAVMDGSGNVTVVWTQTDGTSMNLWSSRYRVADQFWTNAQKLETGALDVKEFQLVVDGAGNVTVVWTQASSDSYPDSITTLPVYVQRTDLWAKRYNAILGGWETEQTIENLDLTAQATENIEDIGEFQLVVDSTGVVSVLWTQHSGSLYDLYATRNVAGTWDVNPTLIDTDPLEKDLGDVTSPQLLMDGSGNLVALWTQSDGTRLNLWGVRYTGSLPVTTTKIDSEDLGNVEAPKAVVDNNGDATVVWRQFSSTDNAWNLWSRRCSGGAWGIATLMNTQPTVQKGDVSTPQLLVYGGTRVMLLWVQSDGTINNVWAKHHNGTGWVDDGPITDGTGNAGSVVMVKDSGGNITAAWVQYDSDPIVQQDNLWANRFVASTNTWGSASLIETQNSGDVRSPMLMVDSADRISAIWLQKESGRFDLWSNHYLSGSWGSPGLIEGIDDGSPVDPHAVMKNSGDITLVWRQPYGNGNPLVTSNYTAGSASNWGPVGTIVPQDYDNGSSPQLLADSTGIVTVTWLQPVVVGESVRVDLWADRF